MHITLDQARCFCALVDAGGYQPAAKELNRSHSAVVYAISTFEKQCDLVLLNRQGYRTRLTAEGERVYRQCRVLLQSAAELEKTCVDLKGGWEPAIRLVYDGVLDPEPFLTIFRQFNDKKVPTVLDIYSDYLHGVEKSFTDLQANFVIGLLPPRQAGLHEVGLKPFFTVLVAHARHELSRSGSSWTREELKRFNFFTVRGADRSLNLGTKELEETSTFHLSDFSFKKAAILKGAGFGWLPEYMIREELKRGSLKPVRSELLPRQKLFPKVYYRKKKPLGRSGEFILKTLTS